MLRKGFCGWLGEMAGGAAGGIESHDQRPGLFPKRRRPPAVIDAVFGAKKSVQPVGPGLDVAQSAGREYQLPQPGLGRSGASAGVGAAARDLMNEGQREDGLADSQYL